MVKKTLKIGYMKWSLVIAAVFLSANTSSFSVENEVPLPPGQYSLQLHMPDLSTIAPDTTLTGKLLINAGKVQFETSHSCGDPFIISGRADMEKILLWFSEEGHGNIVTFHLSGKFDKSGSANGKVTALRTHETATGTWELEAAKEANKPSDVESFTQPITFKFVDEFDAPIRGDFTLHHTKNGKYVENWHRYLLLNNKGEITIKKFPPEFEFGGSSNDEFYFYWIRSVDLDPTKRDFLYRCSPSGAMKFEITAFPKEYYYESLVVEYHKKTGDSRYEIVKGIGIHPDDPEHVVGNLEPGEYL